MPRWMIGLAGVVLIALIILAPVALADFVTALFSGVSTFFKNLG